MDSLPQGGPGALPVSALPGTFCSSQARTPPSRESLVQVLYPGNLLFRGIRFSFYFLLFMVTPVAYGSFLARN